MDDITSRLRYRLPRVNCVSRNLRDWKIGTEYRSMNRIKTNPHQPLISLHDRTNIHAIPSLQATALLANQL